MTRPRRITYEVGTAGAAWLGVQDLPAPVARLAPGMLYGVACDQQAVRLPLIAGALSATLDAGKRCALVTPGDPGIFLRKARLAGFALDAAVKGGQLVVFQLAGDAAKHLFRAGCDTFVQELEKNFPERGAFLALDQADSIFMLDDARCSTEAVQAYLAWAANREHTLLAAFTPAATAAREYLTLRQVAEDFAGFAVARCYDGGAVLEIRHWFASGGASAHNSFVLRAHGSGLLSATTPEGEEELPPGDCVIYVRGTMSPPESWRAWQEAASIAEALDAARRSHGATLLLPFAAAADFELLSRAIVTVRAMARPSLRVIVRERRVRLRASQALALMRLGASAITAIDLSDGAAKRMVDSLQGTRFSRPYDMDARQVYEETSAVFSRPCADAAAFCAAVEGLLAAADGFDIESSLVRLDDAYVDASRAIAMARRLGRDLLAVRRDSCLWVFVFGCAPALVPQVLQRVLLARLEDVCARWSVEHQPERILAELARMRTGGVAA